MSGSLTEIPDQGSAVEFVKNAWYVAGWASEFDNELRSVTILDQPIVVYRTKDGNLAALLDRCPHRLLPLSMGKRIGDDIQCGYHGMTFDCSGTCVRIPGQSVIPPSARVRHFPVCQKRDIVWIWMGDPALADESEIFDLPQFDLPGWDAHQGDALHLKANYLNVAENLVDPAHVSFVHPTTLGNSASEDIPVSVDVSAQVLVASRWIRNAAPVGFFQEFGGFSGHVDRWHYYYLHLPCTAVIDFGSAATDRQLSADDRDQGVRIFALHFLTPVSKGYTIDRWMHLRNTATNDDAVSEKMDALFRIAFAEDKAILEAIETEENKPGAQSQVRLAIDKGPTVYRKRIKQMIDAPGGGPERSQRRQTQ